MVFKYINDAYHSILTYSDQASKTHDQAELAAVRTEAFKLQAFGRIIKRAGSKKTDEGQMIRSLGDNLKTSAKFIEDSLGELLYHFEMAEHISSNERLEEAKLRFTIVKSDFSQHLGWIRKSLDMLDQLELEPLYLKGLIKELKRLEEKSLSLNPKLLEDGTHELRRALRWAVMYIIYPQGLFKYSERNPDTNPYTLLSVIEGFKPYELSFEDVSFLSKSVYELGEVKDEGQVINYSKTKSEINSSQPHIIELTKNIQDVLKQNATFSNLRSSLKKQAQP